MNYFEKKVKKLNYLPNLKDIQNFMESNLKNLMGNIQQEKSVVFNKSFLEEIFISKYGTRGYKIYIPKKRNYKPSLIVMLHGCKQNPDDFAIGTEMNKLAEKENAIVLYPKQSSTYNQSKCWNWFKDEGSSIGESRIIYEMTKKIIEDYSIDVNKIYVAGMSAGGAMAVILVTQHPELYKAAGIHSGLPYKAAKNINMALYSMKNGRSNSLEKNINAPIIVFHGNEDETVNIINGEQIIKDIISSQNEVVSNKVINTNSYSVTSYTNKEKIIAEYWVLKNKGHVWSGGNKEGSYTSASGPSASKEMLRFFKSIN